MNIMFFNIKELLLRFSLQAIWLCFGYFYKDERDYVTILLWKSVY